MSFLGTISIGNAVKCMSALCYNLCITLPALDKAYIANSEKSRQLTRVFLVAM